MSRVNAFGHSISSIKNIIDDEKVYSLILDVLTFQSFASLNKNQQMKHASFQNWFYNDVVQGGVDVPMNFATDIQWKKLFSELGVNLVARHAVGFDQRTSGEYHVIYVCEK